MTYLKKHFTLSRNVLVLGWTSLLNDVASEMIYPLLPVFLTTVMGVGTAFVGVIEGIAESTASLLKVISGWLSDRSRRRKPLTVGGYALTGLARPFLALASAGWHVLMLRFLDRIGKGVRTSPRDALIAESTDAGELGKAFGFHRSMDHLGAVVGPLLASVILVVVADDYRTLFWIASIPGLIAVSLIAFLVKEQQPAMLPRYKQDADTPTRSLKLSFKSYDKRFRWFLICVVLFTLGNSSDAFLLLRAKSLGVQTALLPMLWVVLHVVKASSSMPGGILSDKIGRKPTIISGWIVYGLIYLGFGFASSQAHVWILFALYGIYFGLTEGVEKALVADLVTAERRGTAFGAYHFAIGVSALPASLMFGFVWERFSVLSAFLMGASLAMVAGLLLTVTVKETVIN
jgi:MFS family permease